VVTALESSTFPNSTATIPTSAGTMGGNVSYTLCPNGSDPTVTPEICLSELSWSGATLTTSSSDPMKLTITGNVSVRAEDMPVALGLGICTPTVTLALDGDGSCPGGTFMALPAELDLQFNPSEGNALTTTPVFDTNNMEVALDNNLALCGVSSCSAFCCITDQCACALGGIADYSAVKNAAVNALVTNIQTQALQSAEARFCVTDNGSACPTGTTADANGICRYADNACAPQPYLFGSSCAGL